MLVAAWLALNQLVAVQVRAVPFVRLWCSGNTLACHAGIAGSILARRSPGVDSLYGKAHD